MIISASRRTDIPAWFSDWFLKRLEENYVYVRNPINIHQVSNIQLSPDVVDCIVFWSKNPKPMLSKLDCLKDYMYYFQFTLNAYEADVEQNLPALAERINTFRELSSAIGKERVIWRYDPVLLNARYTVSWHVEQFQQLADKLGPYTQRCTFGYLDLYAKIKNNLTNMDISELSLSDKCALAKELSAIAHAHYLVVDSCAEDVDLSQYQIEHGRCINGDFIAKLLGGSMEVKKDTNQRPACGCASSIDIGLYDTCANGCIYCYANYTSQAIKRNYSSYDPNSSILCSSISEFDKITDRKMKSQKNMQLNLFSN